MRSVKEAPLPVRKEKDRFILRLNKKLYRPDILQKALSKDKDWIKQGATAGDYVCLGLKTSKLDDVLNWLNYLIYLHKV